MTAGDRRVWATEDLLSCSQFFLLILPWQLGQWGFVKKEMSVDDSYEKLIIDGEVIVKVEILNKDLKLTWADEWAQWPDLQDSKELADLCTRSRTMLEKVGKGGGKSKAALAAF